MKNIHLLNFVSSITNYQILNGTFVHIVARDTFHGAQFGKCCSKFSYRVSGNDHRMISTSVVVVETVNVASQEIAYVSPWKTAGSVRSVKIQ